MGRSVIGQKNKISVLIVDDNFAIRYVLKLFIKKYLSRHYGEIDLYSIEDGVEGLGYAYIVEPDFVLLDTTLPKYSGKDLYEFLLSSQRLRRKSKIILLSEELEKSVPANYKVINKRSLLFVNELYRVLVNNQDSLVLHNNSLVTFFRSLLKWSNLSDIWIRKIFQSGILVKILYGLPWFFSQILISIELLILKLFVGEAKDQNLKQFSKDQKNFRLRYYPTIVSFLVGLGVLIFQLVTFIGGGIVILETTDRFEESFAYTNGYNNRRSITIDNTKVSGTTNLTNYPVVISGTYSYLATTTNGGKVYNSSGYDIVFASDNEGANQLDHEIEYYDASTGEIVMWVELPTVYASSNTTFYMFYGNSSVSTSQEDVIGVWNSYYKAVWHMSENPAGTSPQLLDSTTNNNDGTSAGSMASDDQVSGQIDGSLDFDGSNDWISASDADSLDMDVDATGENNTIEAWIKPDSTSVTLGSDATWTDHGEGGTSFIGTEGGEPNDGVDTVVVGDTVYYALGLMKGDDYRLYTATSDLDGGSFSGWTLQQKLTNISATQGSFGGVSVETDGEKLYFVAAHNYYDNRGYMVRARYASMDLDGTNFSNFSTLDDANGYSATGDDASIDMVLTNGKLYYALYYHNGSTCYLDYANSDVDGTNFSGFSSLSLPSTSCSSGGATGISLETDGDKLYYIAYTVNSGSDGLEYAYSDLDGTNLSSWASLSGTPTDGYYNGFVDTVLIGDQLFVALGNCDSSNDPHFYTSRVSKDGTGIQSWSEHTGHNVDGCSNTSGASPAVSTDGEYLYMSFFGSIWDTVEQFSYSRASLTSNPVVIKADAYELRQIAGGLVFTGPGQSRSFGELSTSIFNHVSIVHSEGSTSGYIKYYLDGELQRTEIDNLGYADNTSSLYIGGDGTNSFDGKIDEVNLNAGAFSGHVLLTRYNNYFSPSTFYTIGAEETANTAPSLSNISLNAGVDISLTEGTTTTVNLTATASDSDGYTDLSSSSGVLFRSAEGASCSADDNNCYTDSSCDFSGCSGTSCTVTCSFEVRYFADPTDAGSTYEAQSWQGYIEISDASAASADITSSAGIVDVETLLALNLDSSTMSYGSLSAGEDTGSTNQTIDVENNGNASIGVEVSATQMCTDYPTCTHSIAVAYQEYNTSAFTYGAGVNLSTAAIDTGLSISKVSTYPPSGHWQSLYFGMGLPMTVYPGNYTGTINIVAVQD